jgi:hypothetical protein
VFRNKPRSTIGAHRETCFLFLSVHQTLKKETLCDGNTVALLLAPTDGRKWTFPLLESLGLFKYFKRVIESGIIIWFCVLWVIYKSIHFPLLIFEFMYRTLCVSQFWVIICFANLSELNCFVDINPSITRIKPQIGFNTCNSVTYYLLRISYLCVLVYVYVQGLLSRWVLILMYLLELQYCRISTIAIFLTALFNWILYIITKMTLSSGDGTNLAIPYSCLFK